MFETNPRAARIAFGTTLIAGALTLVTRSQLPFHASAAAIMLGSWIAAFVTGAIAGRLCTDDGPHLIGASIVVPSIGIALMLPLLIHLPFVIGSGLDAYDGWVSLSMMIVGPAHLVLATLVAVRGWRLANGRTPQSILSIYITIVLVSAVPFAALLIPPILVAITGIPFVALLQYQEQLASREREHTVVIPPAFARA